MFTDMNEAYTKTLLEKLVKFDTQNPPGQELACAHFLREKMEKMGCKSQAVDVGEGRTNVAGVFKNGPGPTFAFNTHIDVVPAGHGWSSDPFKLRESDGKLFGRGACDAKGPMTAMLEAMRILIAAKAHWSGTLLGVFVADEEVGSIGAREYVKTADAVDYCAIGEPTSCATVVAHKGSVRPIVRIHGKSAHSGMPDLGVNAIIKSAPLMQRIVDEHERVRNKAHDLVGQASLTVVRANGGVADNVVPAFCDFTLDRRMVPGEQEDEVLKDLKTLIEAAAKDAGTEAEIIGYAPTTGPATETSAHHPIVSAAQHACHHHNLKPTPLTGFQGGCDLVHFRKLGAEGVIIGAGSLQVAHQPDEFVPIDELFRSVLIYRDLAFAMLGDGKTPTINT
jgi:acetylornithine deacetylase/succinyl-diaminopimelate desuccinylase